MIKVYQNKNGFNPFEFNLKDYVHVADLDTNDLEEAFAIGNIGPEEKYTRHLPMHSVSVNDVLEKDGIYYRVASSGFDRLYPSDVDKIEWSLFKQALA